MISGGLVTKSGRASLKLTRLHVSHQSAHMRSDLQLTCAYVSHQSARTVADLCLTCM